MEILNCCKNEEEWNFEQETPFQTTLFPKIQNLDYKFFYASNGKKHLFYLARFGFLRVARMQFPRPDKESLKEFVLICQKNHWIPYISTFEDLKLCSAQEAGFANIINMKTPAYDKGCRCNIKKALKEGVEIKKLETKKDWQEMNLLHNALLNRKNIAYNSESRSKMYEELYQYSEEQKNAQKNEKNKKNNFGTLLYGAFHNNKLISGLVVCYAKRYCLFTKSATDSDAYYLAPGPLLIKTFCNAEKDRFDFFDLNIGVDSAHKSGELNAIAKFKRQFGNQVPVYTNMPSWYSFLRKIKEKIQHKM